MIVIILMKLVQAVLIFTFLLTGVSPNNDIFRWVRQCFIRLFGSAACRPYLHLTVGSENQFYLSQNCSNCIANDLGTKTKNHPKVVLCDPAGTRTQDPIIKSDVLYQLSYKISANHASIADILGVQM